MLRLFKKNSIEESIFLAVAFAVTLASVLYLVVAAAVAYRPIFLVLPAISAFFYGTVAYLSYKRGLYRRLVAPFLIYSWALVVVLWFQVGGFDSDNPLFMVTILLISLMLAPSKRARWFTAGVYLLLFAVLVIVQYTLPELFLRELSREQRTLANIITTGIASVTIAVVVLSFKNRYETHRRRLHGLMKEMNHRIKNNLALVSSLVRLKDDELGDAADLSDIGYQVQSVALIHEKLQETETIDRIRLRSYLDDLLAAVFSQTNAGYLRVTNSSEDLVIDSRRAVAIGLIVNELATNALKYGFGSMQAGEFSVDLRTDSSARRYVLTVSNSGAPFPEEVPVDNPDSLGLRLIAMLVEDLNGTLELARRPSPTFTIIFPR